MNSARSASKTEVLHPPETGALPASEMASIRTSEDGSDSRIRSLPSLAATIAWVVPFALIVYLGMRRGGYEQPVRGEIGIAVWWAVGLGLLAAQLPSRRVGRLGWIGLGLLFALAGWTAISMAWTDSAGRTAIELARVIVYVGVLALALMLGGRGRLRNAIGAVAAACGVIAAVALLSRLHPSWFPADEIARSVDGVQGRLRYPLGYWNALAGLVAIGLPLVLWAATSARSVALRSLAAAAIPVMALTIYFTYSRAGVLAGALAVLAFVALSPRRLVLLSPLALIGGISGLVVWQASRRQSLVDALGDSTAAAQGDEILVVVAVGAVICAAGIWLLSLGEDRGWVPRLPRVPRRTAVVLTAVVAVVGLATFIGVGGPGKAGDGFEEFKAPVSLDDTDARLSSVAGNGRWQYWEVAVKAGESAPLNGVGPGTFEYFWYGNRTTPSLLIDAHSLFVEMFAELGIVGLTLVVALVLLVIGVGAVRGLRAAEGRRGELAALSAAALAFALAAGVDWLWELAVVPVAFLFVAAAILTARDEDGDGDEEPSVGAVSDRGDAVEPSSGRRLPRWAPVALRGAGALLAFGAIFLLAVQTKTATDLSDSEFAYQAGEFERTLELAEGAEDLEPFAAAPHSQRAFALEAMDQYAKASTAAREAIEREATNWENWYLLSRIQAARGDKEGAALVALREAQRLNPLETLVNPVNCGEGGILCKPPPVPG